MSTVIIFAGGRPVPPSTGEELPVADVVIAADSGYAIAESLEVRVDTLVGDMDSIGAFEGIVPETTAIVRYPVDKDATDLELAFEVAVRDQPDRIVLVGAEGGRFDHEMAAAALVCSERWSDVAEIDWVRSDSTSYVIRGPRRIQGDPGDLFSLLPVAGDAHGVTTTGLRWELQAESLYAGSSRGMSNVLLRTEVMVRVSVGVLLGILPRPEVT